MSRWHKNEWDLLPEKAFRKDPTGRMTLEGGGGGGQTTSTGTTTSYSSSLPEYAKPYYEELMKQSAKSTFTTDSSGTVTGVKPYNEYGGERVAGMGDTQQQAISDIAGMQRPDQFGQAGAGMGYGQSLGFQTAGQGLGKALNYNAGQFGQAEANQYMSPYQSAVTDAAVREARLQADMNKQAGALGSIKRGTFGGARQALIQAEQDRGTMQNVSDIRAKGAQAAYLNAQEQFERDRKDRQFESTLGADVGKTGISAGLSASQDLAKLGEAEQTSELARLNAKMAAGEKLQAEEQKQLDMAYQTFREKENYPLTMLEFYSNILRGNAGALGSTQVQYTPQNQYAQAIGTGVQGLAMYNMMNKG